MMLQADACDGFEKTMHRLAPIDEATARDKARELEEP